MITPWHMAVLIPARNEELLLPRCLRSVAAACAVLPAGVTSDIIVVSDGSTDTTADLARAMLQHTCGRVLEVDAGNVGLARALAAETALTRHRGNPWRCWLANTDADCEVPQNWLLDHLSLARRGYTAVAGIVDVDCFVEHREHVETRFRVTYQINDDGTHPHVHGANLGVRADAYMLAGGWNALETAEDHDLWARLRTAGTHLSDARLRVVTSGRRVGRAPLGFAGALAKHNEFIADSENAA
ncbi:glycosyl transferase [Terriglobus roseus DSM 18391]|uniref:Glycosyl transferase n=2 Tax=Terriglobus roseus TaxID=392734 RepID=I3ZCC8_TERRK|nr:glycosyl transferase [Terriglobus roseus DSM 18391]